MAAQARAPFGEQRAHRQTLQQRAFLTVRHTLPHLLSRTPTTKLLSRRASLIVRRPSFAADARDVLPQVNVEQEEEIGKEEQRGWEHADCHAY